MPIPTPPTQVPPIDLDELVSDRVPDHVDFPDLPEIEVPALPEIPELPNIDFFG
jgi:hypothetical protein